MYTLEKFHKKLQIIKYSYWFLLFCGIFSEPHQNWKKNNNAYTLHTHRSTIQQTNAAVMMMMMTIISVTILWMVLSVERIHFWCHDDFISSTKLDDRPSTNACEPYKFEHHQSLNSSIQKRMNDWFDFKLLFIKCLWCFRC